MSRLRVGDQGWPGRTLLPGSPRWNGVRFSVDVSVLDARDSGPHHKTQRGCDRSSRMRAGPAALPPARYHRGVESVCLNTATAFVIELRRIDHLVVDGDLLAADGVGHARGALLGGLGDVDLAHHAGALLDVDLLAA